MNLVKRVSVSVVRHLVGAMLVVGTLTLPLTVITSMAVAAPVTIDFWHSMTGDKSLLLEQLVADFNKNPANKERMKISMTYVGNYVEGINKLRTSLIANKGPHIAQIFEIGTQVMIDSKAATPLEDLIGQDKEFGLDQMLPQVVQYYKVSGRLYSLPFATSNPIIYYNADWFKKAGVGAVPKTFEELSTVAEKLTDRTKKLTGITWPLNAWFFEQFLARQGAVLIDHGNGRSGRAEKANFASVEGIRYLDLLAAMTKAGTFSNVGREWDPPVQNFMAGRSAMLITSTSDVFVITAKSPFKVQTAPLPIPAGMDKIPGGTIIGGNSLWIMKAKPANEQHLAYEFLKYMASSATQRVWHSKTGYFPIRKDVIASLEHEGFYKKYPNAKTAIDQLTGSAECAATQGALMGVFPEAREHLESAIEEVLAGKSTTKQALENAANRTNKALERYNKMQNARK